jgi:hypothetical protein
MYNFFTSKKIKIYLRSKNGKILFYAKESMLKHWNISKYCLKFYVILGFYAFRNFYNS